MTKHDYGEGENVNIWANKYREDRREGIIEWLRMCAALFAREADKMERDKDYSVDYVIEIDFRRECVPHGTDYTLKKKWSRSLPG